MKPRREREDDFLIEQMKREKKAGVKKTTQFDNPWYKPVIIVKPPKLDKPFSLQDVFKGSKDIRESHTDEQYGTND